MKSKWKEILVHLIFWGGSAWIITQSFSIEAQEFELIDGEEIVKIVRNEAIIFKISLCIIIAFIGFYFNLWNISRLLKSTRKGPIILLSIGIFTCTLLLYIILEKLLTGTYALRLPMALSLGILVFYFTVSCGYGIMRIWIQSERQKQNLQIAKKQAELNLLRNQLQPHFLFNALNNLLSMVEQQRSPQLAKSFEQLSQLLRYVIEETKNEKVALDKEIAFLKNYVALQLLRFDEDEIDFRFEISGSPKGRYIEPGLLVSFIENAFKYGAEPEKNSIIHAILDLSQRESIQFSVRNKVFNLQSKEETTGTGIKALRERLDLVYPGKHQLKIQNNDHYKVELFINGI